MTTRPFIYHWSFLAGESRRFCLAREDEPGIISFYERRYDEDQWTKTDKPLGLANELVNLVLLVRGLRCDLATLGAHASACSECDEYDSEDIAACPDCRQPVCDACMANWHGDGQCKKVKNIVREVEEEGK